MGFRTVAVATLSTLLGISVVNAPEAWSTFFSVPEPVRLPDDARTATVDRIMDTEQGPVLLLSVGVRERLPILIGPSEAVAIERGRLGFRLPRPMTHDLLGGVVTALGAKVHHVFVHTLTPGGTFLAEVVMNGEDRPVRVDARPSDAIALAVRTGAPIYVSHDLDLHMLLRSRE